MLIAWAELCIQLKVKQINLILRSKFNFTLFFAVVRRITTADIRFTNMTKVEQL